MEYYGEIMAAPYNVSKSYVQNSALIIVIGFMSYPVFIYYHARSNLMGVMV